MTSIDLNTGMPTAPKGMFWRVTEDEGVSVFDPWSYRRPGVSVELVQTKTTKTLERKQKSWWAFSWYGRHEEVVKVETIVVMAEIVTRIDIVPTDVFETVDGDETVETRKIGIRDVEHPVRVNRTELTAELIFKTAEKVLEAYNQRLKGLEFLGEYPPRVLPPVSE